MRAAGDPRVRAEDAKRRVTERSDEKYSSVFCFQEGKTMHPHAICYSGWLLSYRGSVHAAVFMFNVYRLPFCASNVGLAPNVELTVAEVERTL